jgi:hypothetical protein
MASDERGSFDDTNKAEQFFALVSDALQSSTD